MHRIPAHLPPTEIILLLHTLLCKSATMPSRYYLSRVENEFSPQLCIAVLLPPLSIFLQLGSFKRREFWYCILLTLLGYVPGQIYAMHIIAATDPSRRDEEAYPVVPSPATEAYSSLSTP